MLWLNKQNGIKVNKNSAEKSYFVEHEIDSTYNRIATEVKTQSCSASKVRIEFGYKLTCSIPFPRK